MPHLRNNTKEEFAANPSGLLNQMRKLSHISYSMGIKLALSRCHHVTYLDVFTLHGAGVSWGGHGLQVVHVAHRPPV